MKFLSSSVLLARIRGMEIHFHFSMIFSIPLAYFLFRPTDLRTALLALAWLTGLVLCIFLHELGHALAARLVGVEVKSIVIWILGGLTTLARKPEKPSHNLAIAAAGPLVNMGLGFLFVLTYIFLYILAPREVDPSIFIWTQTVIQLSFSLALLNVILVVFNLLPIYPLDGGNILHAIMDGLFGKSNADWITMLISIPVLLGLVAFGIYTHDFLLLASCVLIALGVGTLNRSVLRRINLGVNYLFKRSGYYFLQGDYERAIQLYTQEIQQEPQQANHYLSRAVCLLNLSQKEKAIADIERALKLAPNSATALELRGEIYSMNKEYELALEYFSRAQAINPHWGVPHFDRASILIDKKEFESALAELNQTISLTSQFPLFYVVRSLANFRLGNLEAAHQDQDVALRFGEKEALTVSPVNLILYKGSLDWAEDFYSHILLSKPHSGYAYQGRADAYWANQEFEKAIADYSKSIQLNPRNVELYLGRGKCYQALHEYEKAKADFRYISTAADKLHLKKQAEEILKSINEGE
ncbi:MAG: M50 family metallopeptidase [Anaerolineales bacterium]